jgi:patatin-related protein
MDGTAVVKDPEQSDRQQIRLAVVLNGGVSLAVWISGVVQEMHRLVEASRRTEDRAEDGYGALLELLDADARIDVIAGTSAGGLNGGFLALGLVHGCTLTGLRDLWRDKGDLGELLRDPREKKAPSVLRGDYFHEQLAGAYRTVLGKAGSLPAASKEETVDLYLTGTLWAGRESAFADDMGRRIVEVDRDATFHFTSDSRVLGAAPAASGDLRTPKGLADQLAVASRCTSSFPGAFEPLWVEVPDAQRVGDRWNSSAGRTNFATSQFVVDGGLLLNKPIRPALEAIHRQPAAQQVRRILAYVVPDPGEGPPPPPTRPGAGPDPAARVPDAGDVLLGVLTRLRSTDSVSRELDEIQRSNDETRYRRRTRDRLATALVESHAVDPGDTPHDLVTAAYPAYREVRKEHAARTIAEQILAAQRDTQWSSRELAAELRTLADLQPLPFIPGPVLAHATDFGSNGWQWGASTVSRLGDLVLDVLKRAVWLAPLDSAVRQQIVVARKAAHEHLRSLRTLQATEDSFWAARSLPRRGTQLTATQDELVALRDALGQAAQTWPGAARLGAEAAALAGCLYTARPALQQVATAKQAAKVDPSFADQQRLEDLVAMLLDGATSPAQVLERMLRLEVVQVAFVGATEEPEQEVELVQLSAVDPALVTGVQLHHFGAFYRRSWRVNDWVRGRLDGCEQLIQILLAPERLKQLGLTAKEAFTALRNVAVPPAGPAEGKSTAAWRDELLAAWSAQERTLRAELAVLDTNEPLPRTFPCAAALIASGLRARILLEELPGFAETVLTEPDPVAAAEDWAQRAQSRLDTRSTPDALEAIFTGSTVVGEQRIAAEAESGSDTLARTVAHATVAATSALGSRRAPKFLATVLSTFRGYALLLWVLVNYLTGRSNFGRHVLSITVGLGAALLALTLVVPAVPMVVPLTGVVLLLAAVSAAALCRGARRSRGLIARLVVALLVAVGALAAAVLYPAFTGNTALRDELLAGMARVGVVIAVILFGVFVAGSGRMPRRQPPPAGRTPPEPPPGPPPPATRPAATADETPAASNGSAPAAAGVGQQQ